MAAKYRKIETRIWNDEKFRSLSDRGKLVFLLLLTHPHMTSLGAMRATIQGMSAEIGWNEKAFREAFGEGFRKALFEYDETACFVCLPRFFKYNKPESPNVVKSWSDAFDLLPECQLKDKLASRVKAFAEGLGEAFRKALPEAFRKAMPNQEQEQEQEQEQDNTPYSPPRKPKPKRRTNGERVYSDEFLQFWKSYPAIRRGSKPIAWEAWQAALQRTSAETLLKAVTEFATSALASSQFCPGPAPWLNQDRWEDDRAAWQRTTSTNRYPASEEIPF